MTNLTHLPADITAALDQYDQDIQDGKITFDGEGFAASYPGQDETNDQVASFVASHVAE